MKYNFLLFLLLVNLYNQPLPGETGFGLSDVEDSLKIIEKVYLHLDRDYYFPGDDIWFKAYLINASDRLLSDLSGNLHIELISPASVIVDSRIIKITSGIGNGDFRLIENLQSGIYRIRAYTNYMRNFSDQLFFDRVIRIINSAEQSEPNHRISYISSNELDINFFPEGGSLVQDITSVVAFKATDSSGKGCEVRGEVFSSAGVQVASFKSTHRGMGKFFIRPAPGSEYYAVVYNNHGIRINKELPKSHPKGVVLSCSYNQLNELIVAIKTNSITLPYIKNDNFLLSVSARNSLLKVLGFRITSYFNSIVLSTDDLPEGIVALTLSGIDSIPFSERLVYIRKHDNINIDIETDKKYYAKRDSVRIKIEMSDETANNELTFLSLSAAVENELISLSDHTPNICSWFLLESDIHGPVEDPAYYFDKSVEDRLSNLDLLLCTQGWRDFSWKYENINFWPENGITISGRVKKLLSNVPLINSNVTVAIISGENSSLSDFPTDSLGKFNLEVDNLIGEARIIASVTDKKNRLQGELILDYPGYLPEKVGDSPMTGYMLIKEDTVINENIAIAAQENLIRQTIKKKYKLTDTVLLDEVNVISRKKQDQVRYYLGQRIAVGIPDKEIIITPYLEKYNDILDVLRGRVAGMEIITNIRDPEDSGIRIRGAFGKRKEPLFMLDGIIVPYSMIATIPVNWIEKIEVLKSGGIATSLSGLENENSGLISVFTRPVSARNMTYKPVYHSVNMKISGYDAPRIFYSPDHSSGSKDNVLPDLRMTLLWVPDIRLKKDEDASFRFFNADNASKIKITVEGMTSNGIPVTAKTEYNIE